MLEIQKAIEELKETLQKQTIEIPSKEEITKTLKDIKFNYLISSVLPDYLYGDSIKLKQAINSILENALNYTTSGEINLEVNGIVKYGVCRLIITISDSGKGMSIEEVNNILSLNSEALSEIDLRNRDGDILNLKEVKKLVSLLGGNLMVF